MKIYNFLNIITGYGKRFNIGKLEKNRKVPWKKHSGCAGRGLDCRRRRIKKLGMYPGHPTGLESAGRPRRSSATARARHK